MGVTILGIWVSVELEGVEEAGWVGVAMLGIWVSVEGVEEAGWVGVITLAAGVIKEAPGTVALKPGKGVTRFGSSGLNIPT